MTNKFKVGDMVRILNVVDSEFKEGAIGVIEDCDHSGYREWKVTVNGDYEWFDADEFELVETTHKDSERIAKLEEEVAELKLIVAQIRKPSTVVEEALANDVTAAQAEKLFEKQLIPKTPNQLRAEIIEKAKGFIEESKNKNGYYKNENLTGFESYWDLVVDFVVNTEKRTIVALLKGYETLDVATKGIAKCDPSDVFNEHIGKAIALGRALGLDVSEFEQAVQPDEVVKGHIVETFLEMDVHHKTIKVLNVEFCDGEIQLKHEGWGYTPFEPHLGDKIINDTNAQYGGVE